MSVTDELLSNNARYAESFTGPLPLPPARGVAVAVSSPHADIRTSARAAVAAAPRRRQ